MRQLPRPAGWPRSLHGYVGLHASRVWPGAQFVITEQCLLAEHWKAPGAPGLCLMDELDKKAACKGLMEQHVRLERRGAAAAGQAGDPRIRP